MRNAFPQGEFFGQRSGSGRYVATNAIIHPVTKQIVGYQSGYGAKERVSMAEGRRDYNKYGALKSLGEHEHRRERCRRYRQQYGRDSIWQEKCA